MKKEAPQRLGEIVNDVLAERGYISSTLEVKFCKIWPEIVGERIARVTECSELKDDVLYVRVHSSAWRQEISFFKREILIKINKHIQESAIKDIHFY